MTPKEINKIADRMIELLEQATAALQRDDFALAETLAKQARDLAFTLPTKKGATQ